MPELPEVEAIRQVLEPQVQGLTIQDIGVHRTEIIAHPSAGEFCGRLMGQTFDRAERRGKFLLFWRRFFRWESSLSREPAIG